MGAGFRACQFSGLSSPRLSDGQASSHSVEATGKSPQLAGWKACPTFFHSSPPRPREVFSRLHLWPASPNEREMGFSLIRFPQPKPEAYKAEWLQECQQQKYDWVITARAEIADQGVEQDSANGTG